MRRWKRDPGPTSIAEQVPGLARPSSPWLVVGGPRMRAGLGSYDGWYGSGGYGLLVNSLGSISQLVDAIQILCFQPARRVDFFVAYWPENGVGDFRGSRMKKGCFRRQNGYLSCRSEVILERKIH